VSGILGWAGLRDDAGPAALAAMAARGDGPSISHEAGPGFAIAAGGGKVATAVVRRRGLILALSGHPFLQQSKGLSAPIAEVAERVLDALVAFDIAALGDMRGDFALAFLDTERARLILAVDRMSVRNIVYAEKGGGIVFGPDCAMVSRHPAVDRNVDQQALYNYLYFHMVPGPATVFKGQYRIPQGHFLELDRGSVTVRPYWKPHFVEDVDTGFSSLKREFRSSLEESVRTFSSGVECGTFLSGGTDSSTLSGLLGIVSGKPPQTFSIGFEAEGYDEMRYARIAARHFDARQHEYYVTPQDVVDAVPRIAEAYDQPFGNASAVPTYYCARLARGSAVTRMLAGDGGDELFGGNVRYARQHRFAIYEHIPESLRRVLIEPVARRLPLTGYSTLLRRAQSYVAQAALPMPDRYESYNLLERIGPANIFTAEFLRSIDTAAPIRMLREVYAGSDAGSLINRMLALDFEITLADNDLPKVTRMCELAGIDVAFPMLHEDVIDFSLQLAPHQKIRGTHLRYFFKRALADFLPAETIAKEKHGFGLPVGAWLESNAELRTLAADNLATLRGRGIVRGDFIDRLLDEHLAVHAAYYGTMVWVLMMLELWFQQHASA
jgi:asparagine synthase (glutamine-hydrolysing)